jgi:hypothetical protein
MLLGYLAVLVASMPGWIVRGLSDMVFDRANAFPDAGQRVMAGICHSRLPQKSWPELMMSQNRALKSRWMLRFSVPGHFPQVRRCERKRREAVDGEQTRRIPG